MSDFGAITSFIWSVADLIRDNFKRGKYQDVILPFTVLRRLDCVLAPTQAAVRQRYLDLQSRNLSDEAMAPLLASLSGYIFYNTSSFTFARLLDDSDNLHTNLTKYLAGFSPNMREVVEKFDFHNTIKKLNDQGLLYLVLEKFADKKVDLHPDKVDNHSMGSIFEELIRKFNDANNENPGEHFTPRDVVSLMARLLLEPDRHKLMEDGINKFICDPCCGTGGMLTVTRDLARDLGFGARFFLYGQEVNPEIYAICKSDLFMQSKDGRDAENILFGSTLADDKHRQQKFDYLIANPPYGKDWKADKVAVEAESQQAWGRFAQGLPRISDGQMLFLSHMNHHLKLASEGGGRLAIILNGSPLFTGDAGSGESQIRGHLLKKDRVEAIIALPEQIFYNTGIATYIWVLNSNKSPQRAGKVQLIDASGEAFWQPMRKSLGSKRREISAAGSVEIMRLFESMEQGPTSKIFDNLDFGYHKIVVERPLRLKFQVSDETLAALQANSTFQALASSKKKDKQAAASEIAFGKQQQDSILEILEPLRSPHWCMDRAQFQKLLAPALKKYGYKLAAPLKTAILIALSQRDESAAVCVDKDGAPEADPELRDTENVPMKEDVQAYLEREVLPHAPDAWVDESQTKEGYEIPFTRHFYQYTPLRPLGEIEAEIRNLEAEIQGMLGEVLG